MATDPHFRIEEAQTHLNECVEHPQLILFKLYPRSGDLVGWLDSSHSLQYGIALQSAHAELGSNWGAATFNQGVEPKYYAAYLEQEMYWRKTPPHGRPIAILYPSFITNFESSTPFENYFKSDMSILGNHGDLQVHELS